jgi:hypothetical protein
MLEYADAFNLSEPNLPAKGRDVSRRLAWDD